MRKTLKKYRRGLTNSALMAALLFAGAATSGMGAHDHGAHTHSAAPPGGATASHADFFTNGGAYMPRIHCMVNEAGQTDWPWVIGIIVLSVSVVAAYLRIFVFWRRSYLAEAPEDRNTKLMDLAYIFLWCAVCGYLLEAVMFVWPAYRLLAIALVVLNFWSWRFAANLGDLRVSLSAKRLQRERDEALRMRNEQLERLVAERTAELEAAREGAMAANDSKSAFLANMSHEIRTPMTSILGFTDLLLDPSVDDAERARFVETIRANGAHLLTIVNDILDLSRIESGKMMIERSRCDPSRLTMDIVSQLRPRALENATDMHVEFMGPIPSQIETDQIRLRQVLFNIIGNAIKFTSRGTITVRLALEQGQPRARLRFDIVDTGIGIDPERIDALFEPFEQGDISTTRRHGGTGLGLNISRRLAHALGGDIGVVSRPGAGSTFTVWIDPGVLEDVTLIENPAEAVRTERALGASATRPLPTLTGRILLAEDGRDNRRLIAFHLRRAGAVVDFAMHGREALDLVERAEIAGTPFSLILMDMQMPEMDGYEATRQLRRRGYRRPIMALTAHAMEADRIRCIEAGCDEYAAKPIDVRTLLTLCADLISGTASQAA